MPLDLLQLPPEARALILSKLRAHDLARSQLVCTTLRDDCVDDALWRRHVVLLLGPEGLPANSHRGIYAALHGKVYAALYGVTSACYLEEDETCVLCSNLLVRERTAEGGRVHVCECVAERRELYVPMSRAPLVIASLSVERVGESGSVDWAPMGGPFRAILEPVFSLELRAGAELNPSLLDGAHILLANLTMAQEALSAHELGALQAFVRAGGTAILNCFSNWSLNEACNRDLVGWLGVRTETGAAFGPPVRSAVRSDALHSASTAEMRALLRGPFGEVSRFDNNGSTAYTFDLAVLNGGAGVGEGVEALEVTHSLHFINGRSAVGSGHVLLCSNFHWLVDENTWHGGTLLRGGHNSNAELLRNLAAIACARAISPSAQAAREDGVM